MRGWRWANWSRGSAIRARGRRSKPLQLVGDGIPATASRERVLTVMSPRRAAPKKLELVGGEGVGERLVQQAQRTGTGTAPFTRPKIIEGGAKFMEDTGTGLDYGTRPDQMPGYLAPDSRFYIRSHAPTPPRWTRRPGRFASRATACVGRSPTPTTSCGTGFPLVSVIRTIECAGNRRVLLGKELGHRFEGTQWGRGAIGTASGPASAGDLLGPRVSSHAREVMPESLDEIRARQPCRWPRQSPAATPWSRCS